MHQESDRTGLKEEDHNLNRQKLGHLSDKLILGTMSQVQNDYCLEFVTLFSIIPKCAISQLK